MPSALRSVFALAFASTLAMLATAACSQQGEGERCDRAKNADADCDSGLTCVSKSELLEGVTDRCCPAAGVGSDKRCTRGTSSSSGTAGSSNGGSSTAGTGGTSTDTAGTGGTSTDTAGTGGTSTGGTSTDTTVAGAAGEAGSGAGGAGG